MKKTTRLFSVLLALVLVFAMAVPALAAGSGTITISNATDNETYSAYRMLDFTPVAGETDKGTYKIADGWAGFFSGTGAGAAYFTVADNESVTIKEGDKLNEIAAAAMAYVTANSITPSKSAVAEGTTVTLEELELGYYLVDTTLGTICALTNTNSKETAIEKNVGPSLVKKIVENGTPVDANTAAIGDTVTYQATITIGKGVEDYVMHDSFSTGLTYQGITSVAVDSKSVNEDNYTVTTNEEDGCTFEIAFDDTYTSALAADTEIVVTYEAIVNENAVVGSKGNPNVAYLEYNTGSDTESRETPKDIVITYTTQITVNKTDGAGNALAGAGFTLYKELSGEWITVKEIAAGTDTVFTWKGLDEGTYKITETTVPAGYNKADDIIFTISAKVPAEVTSADDTATWKAGDTELNGGVYSTTIENLHGTLLPETGGIGTTIFYIVGALLVIGAAVLLITKKRMSAEA